MASKKYFEDVAPTKCFLRRIGESTIPRQSSFSISSRYNSQIESQQQMYSSNVFGPRTSLKDNLLCCYDRLSPVSVIQTREDKQECSIRMGRNVTKEIIVISCLLALILIIIAAIVLVWRMLKKRKSKDIVTTAKINPQISSLWPTGIVVKPDVDWKSNSFSTVSCSKYEQSTKSGRESTNQLLKKPSLSSKDDSLCFTDV
ncbi:unnamed protein product [Oikopleura dioica]|uniref:Uncharacterized protein n=1 Tax=Oikopleura dioica TaxID=34765 RepID=E4XK94_OIKDI|nr:unnamed protein product [Oikopleura dioica]